MTDEPFPGLFAADGPYASLGDHKFDPHSELKVGDYVTVDDNKAPLEVMSIDPANRNRRCIMIKIPKNFRTADNRMGIVSVQYGRCTKVDAEAMIGKVLRELLTAAKQGDIIKP